MKREAGGVRRGEHRGQKAEIRGAEDRRLKGSWQRQRPGSQGTVLPSLTYNQPALAPNCRGPPGHRPSFTGEPSRCRRILKPTASTERF